MSEQKLIFLDIDGTILDSGDVIWPSTAEAIYQARRNGHRLFLCTGRERCFVARPVLELGLEDGVFGAGANAICDGNILYRQSFSDRAYRHMMEVLTRHNALIVLETLEHCITFETLRRTIPDYWEWLRQAGIHYQPQPPEHCQTADKVVFCGADCSLEQIEAELGPDYYMIPASYRIYGTGGEIQQPGLSKATGIARLTELLGASQTDTIGFGDGINDLEMLGYCYQSVAMGNAPDRVKAAASMVTADIKEDGLWLAFRKLGLI